MTGNDVLVDAEFVVPPNQDASSKVFTVYFFTKHKQWLDVMEFEAQDGHVTVNSFSACIAPASLPGSLLFGILFAFFPFQDVGQNKAHILATVKCLNDNGVAAKAVMGRKVMKAMGTATVAP